MKNKQMKLRLLKLREQEVALQKPPKCMQTLISIPCHFGGRVILQLEEGYTKEDFLEASNLLMETIYNQCTFYKELTPEEARIECK